MTIKQQGGIFGRNPTFNDVDVDGTLTVGDATMVAGSPGASQIGVNWTGSIYRITNGYATTQSLYVTTIRTRDSN